MADQLPIRKFIKVWVKKRQNNPRQDGSRTTSYTLEWVEYGKRNFMSLGIGATASYARQAAALKEQELNSLAEHANLVPITWGDLEDKYLTTVYPGHDLCRGERRRASEKWGKSLKSMYAEKAALKAFGRIVSPKWVHDLDTADREKFIAQRITELSSPESIDSDLRALRLVLNQAIEWKHLTLGTNPFAGKRGATIGTKRKRTKLLAQDQKPKHYTRPQITAILDMADREATKNPDDWQRHRLRALIYLVAHTGVRVGEAEHLEWDDLDLEGGIANIGFKIEHGLKTESSANFVGMPDVLIPILSEWKKQKTCNWVFPSASQRPWTTGKVGTKPLDQLKLLAKRAGVPHATWHMFRHSLNTHGKQWFGMSREQMQMQLRHADLETQKHYDQADKGNLRAAVRTLDFRKAEN